MRTDAREMLAVGIFNRLSNVGILIELLVRHSRAVSARASIPGVVSGVVVLCGVMLAAALVPRWIAFAQGPVAHSGAEPPRYEVASVKPNVDDGFGYTFHIDPGTLSASGITLRRLIMTAYQVHGFRIVGAPEWVDSQRWDVQAKHDGPVSPDQIHQMLRTLLEERFQLRSHFEKRQMPVYELVIDRRGAKVPAAKDPEAMPTFRTGNGLVQMTTVTSATFASQLSYSLARPVIDKTGLSGNFDFALEWTAEPGENGGPTTSGLPPGTPAPRPSTADGPSIFTAIREQLGLQLKSGTGPVEVLVIDHAEKPDAN